jgi:hypothetical protein
MTKTQRDPIRTRQRTGTRIASKAMITDPTSSKVETKGFPNPAVDTNDVPRSVTVVPCTNPAIPPPAIRASVHFRKGDISVTNEAEAKVPAMIAAGVAAASRA